MLMNINKHPRLCLLDMWLIMINRNISMAKHGCYLDANISKHNWIDDSWCKHPNVSTNSWINSGMIAQKLKKSSCFLDYIVMCADFQKILIVMRLSLQIFRYHSLMLLTKCKNSASALPCSAIPRFTRDGITSVVMTEHGFRNTDLCEGNAPVAGLTKGQWYGALVVLMLAEQSG